MGKLFVDTKQAASILGCTDRNFIRTYVDTEKVKPVDFPHGTGSGLARRRMFLRTAVEELGKLKK